MSHGSVGTGIVGFGKMGEWHAGFLRDFRGFRTVAVCDAAAGRRSFAENEHDLRSYAALANLLEDEEVELVVVATPSSSHAEVAIQALRAGKHVVVEKPMCMNAAEADSMIKAARRARRTLTVFQNRRWDGHFRTALKVVRSGRLGKIWRVKLVSWDYSDIMLRYGVKEFRPQWRSEAEWGGGCSTTSGPTRSTSSCSSSPKGRSGSTGGWRACAGAETLTTVFFAS